MDLSNKDSDYQDRVCQMVKDSVKRTVQSFVISWPDQDEAKILSRLSPTKLDIAANNISKSVIIPDELLKPEEQDGLDQITMFLLLDQVIPRSFYVKKHRAQKAKNSLLKSALHRSSDKNSEAAHQPPHDRQLNDIGEHDTEPTIAVSGSEEIS